MSARLAVIEVAILLAFLFSPFSVNATRNMNISTDKNVLLGEEECLITASVSGFTDGELIYIKSAFYQSGSTNYFGYTKSGDTWIKNSASNISQRQVKIGDWDGTLTVKSDFGDSGYKGEGDYLLKVGFYYGSYTSVNWSANTVTMTINEPDPTPTNTPMPTNSPTPTPIPTSSPTPFPTKIPTATKVPTATATVTTIVPTSSDDDILSPSASESVVLGATFDATTGSHMKKLWEEISPYILGCICLAVGCILFAVAMVIKIQRRV